MKLACMTRITTPPNHVSLLLDNTRCPSSQNSSTLASFLRSSRHCGSESTERKTAATAAPMLILEIVSIAAARLRVSTHKQARERKRMARLLQAQVCKQQEGLRRHPRAKACPSRERAQRVQRASMFTLRAHTQTARIHTCMRACTCHITRRRCMQGQTPTGGMARWCNEGKCSCKGMARCSGCKSNKSLNRLSCYLLEPLPSRPWHWRRGLTVLCCCLGVRRRRGGSSRSHL